MSRIGDSPDRMESRGKAYFENVRAGFLHEAKSYPRTVAVVDASRDVETIQNEIRTLAKKKMTNVNGETR